MLAMQAMAQSILTHLKDLTTSSKCLVSVLFWCIIDYYLVGFGFSASAVDFEQVNVSWASS